MRMKVDVDTSKLSERLTKMSLRATNFKPVFWWTFRELEKAHEENFRTQGAASGFPWKPLDPQYAAWKIENYGYKGILVREGNLQDSLTMNSGRGAIRDVGRRSAEFGTRVEYAKFHQAGTRHMQQRKPLFVPRLMAEKIGNVTAEYIVHGSVGTSVSGGLVT